MSYTKLHAAFCPDQPLDMLYMKRVINKDWWEVEGVKDAQMKYRSVKFRGAFVIVLEDFYQSSFIVRAWDLQSKVSTQITPVYYQLCAMIPYGTSKRWLGHCLLADCPRILRKWNDGDAAASCLVPQGYVCSFGRIRSRICSKRSEQLPRGRRARGRVKVE